MTLKQKIKLLARYPLLGAAVLMCETDEDIEELEKQIGQLPYIEDDD
jgi:hypothetical protein